jgi:hypothetical protein
MLDLFEPLSKDTVRTILAKAQARRVQLLEKEPDDPQREKREILRIKSTMPQKRLSVRTRHERRLARIERITEILRDASSRGPMTAAEIAYRQGNRDSNLTASDLQYMHDIEKVWRQRKRDLAGKMVWAYWVM